MVGIEGGSEALRVCVTGGTETVSYMVVGSTDVYVTTIVLYIVDGI